MIVAAYMLALAIGSNSMTEQPELKSAHASVDHCLVMASKLNHGTVDTKGSIAEGTLHYCVRVVYPA